VWGDLHPTPQLENRNPTQTLIVVEAIARSSAMRVIARKGLRSMTRTRRRRLKS